jgi:hypothetical protein
MGANRDMELSEEDVCEKRKREDDGEESEVKRCKTLEDAASGGEDSGPDSQRETGENGWTEYPVEGTDFVIRTFQNEEQLPVVLVKDVYVALDVKNYRKRLRDEPKYKVKIKNASWTAVDPDDMQRMVFTSNSKTNVGAVRKVLEEISRVKKEILEKKGKEEPQTESRQNLEDVLGLVMKNGKNAEFLNFLQQRITEYQSKVHVS